MECAGVVEEKKRLRALSRQSLAGLDGAERREQDKALGRAFLGLEAVKGARTVMLYWGVAPESSTAELISALLVGGKRVALPRCLPGGGMEARLYRGERLSPGAHGIPEPGEELPRVEKKDVDVVLVPALCYDRGGFRLGRGGGYYDRWLTDYPGVSVGMCYKQLLKERLPRQEHDRPVTLLLSID